MILKEFLTLFDNNNKWRCPEVSINGRDYIYIEDVLKKEDPIMNREIWKWNCGELTNGVLQIWVVTK